MLLHFIFLVRLAKTMSESTVCLIKVAHLEGVKRKSPVELNEEEEDSIALPLKKCGWPCFGRKAGCTGTNIPEKVRERHSLSENCDCSWPRHHTEIHVWPKCATCTCSWVWWGSPTLQAVDPWKPKRVNPTQRKATTMATSKEAEEDFAQVKLSFLTDVVATVVMQEKFHPNWFSVRIRRI